MKYKDNTYYWIKVFNEWHPARFIEFCPWPDGAFEVAGVDQEISVNDPLITAIDPEPLIHKS